MYSVRYRCDDRPWARLQVRVPSMPCGARAFMDASVALYLGSLALAREIRLRAPVPHAMLAKLMPVAEALYDIRRWRDDLPLSGLPTIQAPGAGVQRAEGGLDPQGSMLLWSGGKDSTLGLLTLRENGYAVVPIHMSVNIGAEEPESRAIGELSTLLSIGEIDRVPVDHPDFLPLSSAYADAWDAFPLSNRVPFGRDLLLTALAVPWALCRGVGGLSLGHDHECRTAYVEYRGKRIPRNDMECADVAVLVGRTIREFVHADLRLLPPVANLAELRILRDMLVGQPALMAHTSFCFWGRSCGRCAKCLRYYLADRVFDTRVLQFETNPLASGACPELQDLLEGREALFESQVLWMLGRLVQRGDIRADEAELSRFARGRYAEVEPLLDAWEADLMATRSDPQIPPGFRALSDAAEDAAEVRKAAAS